MGDVTPLFVGGMARSGTTNALHVLNAHPEVMLNGEISLAVLKHFFALLDGVERSYAEKDEVLEAWHARKAQYMFESFGYLCKGGRGALKKVPFARFRGHKTPRAESLFDRYEAHFRAAELEPRYFYCARNPFDCWRSHKLMAWNNYESVESFIAQYAESFAQLAHMQGRAAGRVFVLNLDELIAARDPVAWYRVRMFAPLGLEISGLAIRRIAESVAPKKPSTAAELSAAEDRAIRNHPLMAALIEEMFPSRVSAASG
jgi:hypothetical protein